MWPLSDWSVGFKVILDGGDVSSSGYLKCSGYGPSYCAQFLLPPEPSSWFVYGLDISIEDNRVSPSLVTSVGFAPKGYQEREIGMGDSFGWCLDTNSSYFSSTNYKRGELNIYSPPSYPFRSRYESKYSTPQTHHIHIGWESLTKEVYIEHSDRKAHYLVDLESDKRIFLTIIFTPSPFLKIKISKPSPDSVLKYVRRGPKLEWLIRLEQNPAPHFDPTKVPDDCWFLILSRLETFGPLVGTCKSLIGTVVSYAKNFLGSDFVQDNVIINWHKFFEFPIRTSILRCGFDKLGSQYPQLLRESNRFDIALERKFKRTIDLYMKTAPFSYYSNYLMAAVRSGDDQIFDIILQEHKKRGFTFHLSSSITACVKYKNKYALDALLYENFKFDDNCIYKLLSYGGIWREYLIIKGTHINYDKMVLNAFIEKDVEMFTKYYENVNSVDTFYKWKFQFSDPRVQNISIFMQQSKQHKFDFSKVSDFSCDMESLKFYVSLEKTNLRHLLDNLFGNYKPVIEEEKMKYEVIKQKWTLEEIYSITPSPLLILIKRNSLELLREFLGVFPTPNPPNQSLLDALIDHWEPFEVFVECGLQINREFLQRCFITKKPKHVHLIMSKNIFSLNEDALHSVDIDYISFPNFAFLWSLMNTEEQSRIARNLLWKINKDIIPTSSLGDLSSILQEIPRLKGYDERRAYLLSTPILLLRNIAMVLAHPPKDRKMGCTPFLRACKLTDGLQILQLMYCFYPEGPLDLETRYRNSSLHIIARQGSPEMAAFVLSFNPNLLNQENLMNETPLHVASKTGNAKVTKYLLQQSGIMVNPRDSTRCTPFLRACKSGSSSETVAEFLNNEEVDCEAVTDRGESALQILISRKCIASLKIFVPYLFKKYHPSSQSFTNSTYGLPNLPTLFKIFSNGSTPLEMAFRLRYLAIADYLLVMALIPKKNIAVPPKLKHTKACRWLLREEKFQLLLNHLIKEAS